ncbi:hypothetical protein AB0F72_21050 [Actinoplanes sp. NPDC023936]|uniref:hypothetical protein n=1 Tax=Actinoplanes sp. NPDC023936 TaxID=3154910 RepID=UPI0033F400AB
MGEYWGATADPNYGYSPYSGQLRYGTHPPSQIPFTPKPGPGNPLTVEAVATKIRNLHPEQMAALADQWQNAWSLMADVRTFVVQQSTVLQDEHWKSPAARDAFLRRGPGETLTYLDVWMDAAQNNITALRHMVNVSLDARRDLDLLLARYERELRDAENVSFGENLGSFLTSGVSWNAARAEEVKEDQTEIRERYRREAQSLAQRYADQFFDYIAVVASGVGPPVQPMNAVLSQPIALPPADTPPTGLPGQNGPSFITSPVSNETGTNQPGQNAPGQNAPGQNAPGQNAPGLNPPAVAPPGVIPPGVVPPGQIPPGTVPPGRTPPGTVPPGLTPPGTVPPSLRPPGTIPPGLTPPGSIPPGITPPSTLPPGAVPPGVLPPGQIPTPGGFPPGTFPPGVTPPGTVPPGTVPGTVPPNVIPPGQTGPGNLPPTTIRPPLPGQFGRPGRAPGVVPPPGSAPPPGRSLRRPAAPAPAAQPPLGREIRRPGQPPLPFPQQTPQQTPQQAPQPGRPGARPTTPVLQQPGRPGATPGTLPGAPPSTRPGAPGPAGRTGTPGSGRPGPLPGAPGGGRAGTAPGGGPMPGGTGHVGGPGGVPAGPVSPHGGRSGRSGTPPVPRKAPQAGRPGGGDGGRPPTSPVPAQPGGPGDRVPGLNSGTGVRTGYDTFGRTPGSAAPPVLKNPAGERAAQPGSAEETRPAAGRGTGHRPGATPPVLNRPVSPAGPGARPPQPSRRDRGTPWADWLGGEDKPPAAPGVIGAPERSRPVEGPWGLRSPAATRPEGTVAPELGRRRLGGEPVPVREPDDLVTHEQAFGVRTPGGGVVGGSSASESAEEDRDRQ